MTAVERRVRTAVFRHFADHGVAPSSADLARAVSVSADEVRSTLRALAAAHLVVLDERGRIEMAGPFAAKPTPVCLTCGDRSWWANCAWDGLAIPPLVGVEATLSASCPDCGEPLAIAVGPMGLAEPADGGRSVPGNAPVIHYVVPASHWWDDIRHT